MSLFLFSYFMMKNRNNNLKRLGKIPLNVGKILFIHKIFFISLHQIN